VSIVERALEKVKDTVERPRPAAGAELRDGTPKPLTTEIAPPRPHAAAVARIEQPRFSVELVAAELFEAGLVTDRENSAHLRDEFRRLKWPLLEVAQARQVPEANSGRLLLVTSAVPGEGKTFTSFNLALALADERDKMVVLVDADIAKPKLTHSLGLQARPGLADYLADEMLEVRDILVGTSLPNLRIVPAGRFNSHAPELIASQRMRQLLAQLDATCGMPTVLFDSSPLLVANAGQVLSGLVGQIVMVVKADTTPQSAVSEALSMMQRNASVGLVLNQCRPTFGSHLYGEYYGYSRDRE
jgi:exopolysaccharide/PEP-CTERM locus tyrosine autokinase